MKRLLLLLCALLLAAPLSRAHAAAQIPVIVASSVDTSDQNYTNIFYNKFVELAQ